MLFAVQHFQMPATSFSYELRTVLSLQSLSAEVSKNMPIEPLNITASVISVTCLAYESCKALRDVIKNLRNAPETLKSLYNALGTFEDVTKSLQHDLDGLEDSVFSADQKNSLRALEPVMQYCNTVCNAFATRLAELTSHSDQDRITWIDRFRLHFNDGDIRLLKENLAQCQRTLNDALTFTNLYVMFRTLQKRKWDGLLIEIGYRRTANRTRVALDELAANYAQSVNDIGGRLQGLELSMQAFTISSTAAARNEMDEVVKVLKEHERILKLCLQVYQPALKETSSLTGTTVKYARAFDTARVATGNIDFHGGAPATHVESAVASDQSRIFSGNMSGEAAKAFWN